MQTAVTTATTALTTAEQNLTDKEAAKTALETARATLLTGTTALLTAATTANTTAKGEYDTAVSEEQTALTSYKASKTTFDKKTKEKAVILTACDFTDSGTYACSSQTNDPIGTMVSAASTAITGMTSANTGLKDAWDLKVTAVATK